MTQASNNQISHLQNSIEIGMTKEECAFSKYLARPDEEPTDKERIKKDLPYMQYFNYELGPDTWNLLVNKQIYMKFERLHIERQLFEKKRKEEELIRQIEQVEAETQSLIQKREILEKTDMKQKIQDDLRKKSEERKQ